MKKILFSAALFLSGLAAFGQQPTVNRVETVNVTGAEGIQGLVVEVLTPTAAAYAAGVPAGALTYRVFVNLTDDYGYSLLGYTGNDAALIPFEVRSTAPFFNFSSSGFGGQDGSTQNTAFWSFPGFEAMRYDSYGADGRVGSTQVGIPFSMDTDGTVDGITAINAASTPLSSLIMPVSHPVLLDNTTLSMVDLNGGMYIVQAKGPTTANMVFVMQLTTAGDLTFTGTVSVRNPSGVMVKADRVGWSSVVVVNQPPVVSVLAPASANKDQLVTFTANASDTDGQVVSVEFLVNGSSIGVDNDGSNGWSIDWSAIGGPTVAVTAIATDNSNATTTSAAVSVNIVDACPTTISNLSPANGATNNLNAITLSADVADCDQIVSEVVFSINGSVVGTDTDGSNGWSVSYTPTAATNVSYTVTALGVSSTVQVSFVNATPVISSLTPSGFSVAVGSDTTFIAAASDADGSVSSVIFQVSGAATASFTDNSAPFEFTYAPTLAGSYTVRATATDNRGAQSAQATATFTAALSSASGYAITPTVDFCSAPDIFCLPIQTTAAVSDVIGYDIDIVYDNTLVNPTGVVIASEDLIADRDYTSYSYNVVGDTLVRISLFINGSAPVNTSFNGEGQVFCVEFARNASWGDVNTTTFSVPVLTESYIGGFVDLALEDATYSTIRETEFYGDIKFWASSAPLSNDIATDITPAGAASPVVNPLANGSFVWDITNGLSINIVRDVAASVSVMPVINGYDAYLTSKVSVGDEKFKPNVYQIIAMDVNRDSRVTAGDVTNISQRAVMQLDEFATDWLFIPLAVRNNDYSYRISANYPDGDGVGYTRLSVPAVADDIQLPVDDATGCPWIEDESYKAVLLGDADGSYMGYAATANPVVMKSTAAVYSIIFDLENATLLDNSVVEIPVKVSADVPVNSLDFDMNTGGFVTFERLIDKAGVEEIVNANIAERVLVSSYSRNDYPTAEETVFGMQFKLHNSINSADLSFGAALVNGISVEPKVVGSISIATDVETTSLTAAAIYPNPTNNQFNVVFNGTENVALFNISGQLIEMRRDVNGSTTFDVNELQLPAGLYTVKVGVNAYSLSVTE